MSLSTEMTDLIKIYQNLMPSRAYPFSIYALQTADRPQIEDKQKLRSKDLDDIIEHLMENVFIDVFVFVLNPYIGFLEVSSDENDCNCRND